MTNNYYQNHKENPRKEAGERYQNLSEEEKDKRQKRPKKDIKILLKKKKKKGTIRIFLRNKRRN